MSNINTNTNEETTMFDVDKYCEEINAKHEANSSALSELMADSLIIKMQRGHSMQVFIAVEGDEGRPELTTWMTDLYKKGYQRLHDDGSVSWYEDWADLNPGDHECASDAFTWDKSGNKARHTRYLYTSGGPLGGGRVELKKVWKDPTRDW